MRRLLLTAGISLGLCSCRGAAHDAKQAYEMTARFPHDSSAYTQGLVWADSVLYESTGLYGHSDVRRVDLRTGKVLSSRALPANRFGEGLALLNGRLYQLTWKEGIAYSYDAATLAPRDSFRYSGEGWGLATDGSSLIMSDGSDSLRVLAPATFQLQRVIHVRYMKAPLYQLNELEYANGELLANVYQSNWVLRIDPATGDVRQTVDLGELYQDRPAFAEVMNGSRSALMESSCCSRENIGRSCSRFACAKRSARLRAEIASSGDDDNSQFSFVCTVRGTRDCKRRRQSASRFCECGFGTAGCNDRQ